METKKRAAVCELQPTSSSSSTSTSTSTLSSNKRWRSSSSGAKSNSTATSLVAMDPLDLFPTVEIGALDKIEAVHKILEVVCHLTGLGFSAVAKVTDNRWVACSVRDEVGFGLKSGDELVLETTICNEIRQHHNEVVIENVSGDECFKDHPTPKAYGFQSYLSFPIIMPDGRFFGTLCALDPKPTDFNKPSTVTTIKLFTDLLATHVLTQERLKASEVALKRERAVSKLREQFVAVLGHDLRNPLSAIICAAELLLAEDPKNELYEIIDQSGKRMNGLISDILDFAKGRLGDGIRVKLTPCHDLASRLRQVVQELEMANPNRSIKTVFEIPTVLRVDPDRIAQLLSNLIGNSIRHGDPQSPIVVRAGVQSMEFELSVSNSGPPIPLHITQQLFKPFTRGRPNSQQGLGLGLYIVNEIANAHGGKMEVRSGSDLTAFTFKMPLCPTSEPTPINRSR